MSTLSTGSNKKYADGWENVFGGKKKAPKKKIAKQAAPKKKAAKKSTKRR